MQTVRDFVTCPITGIAPVNTTVEPLPEYMITGVARPVAQLQYAPTIAEVTNVPTPWRYLWRRSYNRLTR